MDEDLSVVNDPFWDDMTLTTLWFMGKITNQPIVNRWVVYLWIRFMLSNFELRFVDDLEYIFLARFTFRV